ncbi:jg9668 [Pararge aegeria aegeria]|uniref:Jg9668 protein n=1 Tax=Pararge aegeria aegeria TaxID=348720 RepID=A0A8S4RUE9_9NEOP|nr:jg9668 [Pararge aegeria aegeria]
MKWEPDASKKMSLLIKKSVKSLFTHGKFMVLIDFDENLYADEVAPRADFPVGYRNLSPIGLALRCETVCELL